MPYQYQGYSNKMYSGYYVTAYSDVHSTFSGCDLGVSLLISELGDRQTRVSLKKLSSQNSLNKIKDKPIMCERKVKICGLDLHIRIQYIIRTDANVYVEVIGLEQI